MDMDAENAASLQLAGTSSPHEDDDDAQPLQPLFYFNKSEYTKLCKLSSRSEDNTTMDYLKTILSHDEKKWFSQHPQFMHIWHLHKEDNHMYSCMWMLLLRTVRIDMDKVCWFVVNGVPIRYSIREHALLCGLDCHSYPQNHKELGSEDFVQRHFGNGKKAVVRIKDVRKKLASMEEGEERLKMAILLFLSTIIGPNKKFGYIEPFFLRIVDDLYACEMYPWGRYNFEYIIKKIFHMMKQCNGRVKSSWCFSGFLLPLEVNFIFKT